MQAAIDLANPRSRHWHDQERAKVCVRCGETKPLAEFYSYGYTTNQGKRSVRHESRCQPCARERRLTERDAAREARSMKAWRAKNGDHCRQKAQEYQVSEHGKRTKARLQRIRKARQRAGMGGREDRAAVRAIYAQAAALERVIARCSVFNLPELGKRLHVDHIVALSKGGPHVASNLQILPVGLNLRKGAR